MSLRRLIGELIAVQARRCWLGVLDFDVLDGDLCTHQVAEHSRGQSQVLSQWHQQVETARLGGDRVRSPSAIPGLIVECVGITGITTREGHPPSIAEERSPCSVGSRSIRDVGRWTGSQCTLEDLTDRGRSDPPTRCSRAHWSCWTALLEALMIREIELGTIADVRLTELTPIGGGEGFATYTAKFEGEPAFIADSGQRWLTFPMLRTPWPWCRCGFRDRDRSRRIPGASWSDQPLALGHKARAAARGEPVNPGTKAMPGSGLMRS